MHHNHPLKCSLECKASHTCLLFSYTVLDLDLLFSSSRIFSFPFCFLKKIQIIVQGLKHLNRAIHEDVVAVELLAKDEWVAPSSVVLQDDGQNEENIENEEEKENIV